MRGKIIAFIILLLFLVSPSLWSRDNSLFGKGVAYFLIGDNELATQHWEIYFENFPDPSLRGAFMSLIEQKPPREVATLFKRYLDINHRSTMALVGIALSTTNMKLSTSVYNLNRALRLDPSYSSAYLCLGAEYIKKEEYPRAKEFINKALRYKKIPEYKILLAKLYLKLDQPQKVLDLLKSEADRYPDNFYYNYYVAKAYFFLNQLNEMHKYLFTASEIRPDDNNAGLLMAKYYYNVNNLQRANSILKNLKFDDYNADYFKTFAKVLLKKKNVKSKNYLDNIFYRDMWDKDINMLMGQFYLGSKKGNVQNWINRSILSGVSIEQLKKSFSSLYRFPEYSPISFFDIDAIKWISDEYLIVAAKKVSGDKNKIYIIDAGQNKITNVFNFKGKFQEFFLSNGKDRIIFSAVASENVSVYIYAIEISEKRTQLSSLSTRAFPFSNIDVGFNYGGSLAYITDKRLAKLAFESPFSIVSEFGEKTPVYPSYPFPIYQYNFTSKKLSAIDINQMNLVGSVPIESVKRYHMVYEAHESKSAVHDLIDKGKTLDLTSSEIVKIHFSKDDTAFIIYLSDLKNAFQAVIYENFSNRVYNIDETMFIGANNYAEVIIKNFDPHKKRILVQTKDEKRRLITFSYRTYLSLLLADQIIESKFYQEQDMHFILTERNKKSIFTETNLEIISNKPYFKEVIGERRDLDKILFIRYHLGLKEVYFSTFTGEILMMDEEHQFHYVGPSFEGSIHKFSPSYKKCAAFINEGLFILNSVYRLNKKVKSANKK